MLLVVGTILAGARVRRRSDLRKVAPVAIGAALLLVGLVWLPIDAFGSQWAAQSEFAPMPAASGAPRSIPMVISQKVKRSLAELVRFLPCHRRSGLVKVERLGGTFAWSSAVLAVASGTSERSSMFRNSPRVPRAWRAPRTLPVFVGRNTYGRSGPSQDLSLLRRPTLQALVAVPFPQGSGPAPGATLSCGDGHCFVISRNELVRSDDGESNGVWRSSPEHQGRILLFLQRGMFK